jgi:hypothetical protein
MEISRSSAMWCGVFCYEAAQRFTIRFYFHLYYNMQWIYSNKFLGNVNSLLPGYMESNSRRAGKVENSVFWIIISKPFRASLNSWLTLRWKICHSHMTFKYTTDVKTPIVVFCVVISYSLADGLQHFVWKYCIRLHPVHGVNMLSPKGSYLHFWLNGIIIWRHNINQT